MTIRPLPKGVSDGTGRNLPHHGQKPRLSFAFSAFCEHGAKGYYEAYVLPILPTGPLFVGSSAHKDAVHLSAMVMIVTYPQVSTGCGQHVGVNLQ